MKLGILFTTIVLSSQIASASLYSSPTYSTYSPSISTRDSGQVCHEDFKVSLEYSYSSYEYSCDWYFDNEPARRNCLEYKTQAFYNSHPECQGVTSQDLVDTFIADQSSEALCEQKYDRKYRLSSDLTSCTSSSAWSLTKCTEDVMNQNLNSTRGCESQADSIVSQYARQINALDSVYYCASTNDKIEDQVNECKALSTYSERRTCLVNLYYEVREGSYCEKRAANYVLFFYYQNFKRS